jgi:hypothetical protein
MFLSRSLMLLCCGLSALAAAAAPGDQASGYAEMEPPISNSGYPDWVTESLLDSLPLDDPKLRLAYAILSLNSGGAVSERPQIRAIRKDLQRRGGAATPLLLDIMDKNRNTDLEHMIPRLALLVGIKPEPYLNYFRGMIRTRPMEVNGFAFEVVTDIFFDYGTSKDVQMMKELAARRPYLVPSLQTSYEHQRRKVPVQQQPGDTDPAKVLPNPEDAKRVGPPLPVDKPHGSIGSPLAAVETPAPTSGEATLFSGGWAAWAGVATAFAAIAAWMVMRAHAKRSRQ